MTLCNAMEQERIRNIKGSLKRIIERERTKTVMQFVLFLFISFVFWLIMTMNDAYEQDITVPLQITSIPKDATIITDIPASIKISVNEKGSNMMNYSFGRTPTMTLDFNSYNTGNGLMRVSATDLRTEARKLFSNEASVMSHSPDSLRIVYTQLPPKSVPVKLDLDVQPNLQYVINGGITCVPDSVLVYSDSQTLAAISQVRTLRVTQYGLTDTLRCKAEISPVSNTKIVPKVVELTVPVEQLINKRQTVDIDVQNCPAGSSLLTFPAVAEVSFLVPQSVYRQSFDIKVAVDYNDIDPSASNMLPLRVVEAPAICKSISIAADSVEYLVDKY